MGDEPPTLLHEMGIACAAGESASASFKATLNERGTVLLLAMAEDESGSTYRVDGAIIDVT